MSVMLVQPVIGYMCLYMCVLAHLGTHSLLIAGVGAHA
jgi:hypothetical protein